jgi:hypothetical protein
MPARTLRTRALPLLPLAAGMVLLACGGPPSTGDMADRAEQFIEDDLDGAPDAGGITFEDAECQEPTSTETNTAFVCTSTGSDGTDYTFTVTIVGRNTLDLVSQPPLPGRSGATTTTTPGTAVGGSSPAATSTTAAAATTTTGG